jgi:hypothetical protein
MVSGYTVRLNDCGGEYAPSRPRNGPANRGDDNRGDSSLMEDTCKTDKPNQTFDGDERHQERQRAGVAETIRDAHSFEGIFG